MALRLDDKWLWDFWFIKHDREYHVFYLQAPRSLGDESLRHKNASIGHAMSYDLRSWSVLPDALKPSDISSAEEPFDSSATWTGSVIKHNGIWYLFYTGTQKGEQGLVQRVGLATSADLLSWFKYSDNPLIEADSRWYELLDLNCWHEQAWRDPWVFEAEGKFHALMTARSKSGEADARGVIGHATSTDLLDWQVQAPLTEVGEFGHMEVPQLLEINDRYYLLFCTVHNDYSTARKTRPGIQLQTGMHYLVSDNMLGPYRYLSDDFLLGDEHGSLYAGKMIQDPSGAWQLMAFLNFTREGEFIGELGDPIPITVLDNGQLRVQN